MIVKGGESMLIRARAENDGLVCICVEQRIGGDFLAVVRRRSRRPQLL